MDIPLLQGYTGPIMEAALNFIERKIKSNDVLIHCNQDQSRAPSIALLYLAKRAKEIPNNNYTTAKQEFLKIIPAFEPSRGIEMYMFNHWEEIV